MQGCIAFDALFSHNARATAESRWLRNVNGTQRFDDTCPNVTRSGEPIWCRWKLGVVRNGDGSIAQITAVADDVTSEHHAESELRASEERFRKLIEGAPIAIGMHRNGIGVYSNQAHCSMFGYAQPSDVIGKPLIGLVAPEERDGIFECMRRRAQGETMEPSYDFIALRCDGSRFRASTHVIPLDLPEGPTMITFHTDITERRQAEELNRRIVETGAEGIWAIDENERTVFVNRRMCEMLGYTEEEIRAKPARDFMTEITRSDQDVHVANRRAGQAYTREVSFWRKDGRELYVSLAGAPLRDVQGRFEGIFGMFTDITDRKRAERALRESEERFRAVLEQASVGFNSNALSNLVNPTFLPNRRA